MAEAESSTPTGEQGQHPDPKQRDTAEAKMHAAPIKGFADLPDDHPMAKRASMMEAIEKANELLESGDEEGAGEATTAAIATAAADGSPPISTFTDPPVVKDAPVIKPKKTAAETAAAQVAAQTTTTPTILEAADLDKYQVRTKIDGVEELVPASRALGQFQKGAAADVRLANATKEAKAIIDDATKRAQQATAQATTTDDKTVAQHKVKDAKAATEKFKEASDAMYGGNIEEAAKLFSEAVELVAAPATEGRAEGATLTEDLVGQVTTRVTQQLSQQGALKQLFDDYPDIKNKRAFGILTDEYINAFMANGDDAATAIHKAGEAIGEEYKLGKWAAQTATTKTDVGRPVNTGGPTTRAEKLSAKEELDNIQSGNARSTSTEKAPQTVQEEIEEMRKARPGQAT